MTKTVLSEKTRNDILKTIKNCYSDKMYKHNGFEFMSNDCLIKHLLTFYRY